jgi:hypothetical protein
MPLTGSSLRSLDRRQELRLTPSSGKDAMDKDSIDKIDKIVKRVTVVQGSGENRHAEVIYEKDEEEDDENLKFKRLERGIRHMLKAQLIAAQEAYQRHLNSIEKGGTSWLTDAPGNLVRAGREAAKEMRKSFRSSEDEDEDQKKGG